jgi:hypothetical protein
LIVATTFRDNGATESPGAQHSHVSRGDQLLIGTGIILIVGSALGDVAARLGLVDPISATPKVLAAGVVLAIVGVLRADQAHLVSAFPPPLRFGKTRGSARGGGRRTIPKPAP